MFRSPLDNLSVCFAEIDDPRVEARCWHTLDDILNIAICAVLSGADDWVAVETYGKRKERWLRSFLDLPYGIPSHDTFGRVFALIDPQQFRKGFMKWVQGLYTRMVGAREGVAIDGKTLRRAHDRANGQDPVHIVSAWATRCRLVLGQIAVQAKSNEITAIPALLECLDLADCVVTIDAIGCQRSIVTQLVAQKADYLMQVKDNQPILHERIKNLFAGAERNNYKGLNCDQNRTINKDHGRIEIRQCCVVSDESWLLYLQRDPNKPHWTGLRSVVRMIRQHDRDKEPEESYYITSLPPDAELVMSYIRGHWGIETSLHWVLDIAYREDESRVRKGHGAENLAVLRHLTLNLLKQEKSLTCGIRSKRLSAGWDDNYMIKVLSV
jgi:predicted transposase YbfD/YdcC